jgi:hypothetical protein
LGSLRAGAVVVIGVAGSLHMDASAWWPYPRRVDFASHRSSHR